SSASRLLGVQLTPELAARTGTSGGSFEDVVTFHERILIATKRQVRREHDASGTTRLVISGDHPFDAGYPPSLREALFEFHRAATRMLNGHVDIERSPHRLDGEEIWHLRDTGEWLW